MLKSFNTLGFAGIAAALFLTPAIGVAQDQPATEMAEDAGSPAAAMTPEQEAMMQSWPADQQAAFKAWPAETQAYYWSLNAERQKMFWSLSDGDKVTLSTMAEPQRESTWAQIESRMKAPAA